MPVLTINGHDMHYQDIGSGPVLLFGHSFLWDCGMWQPQIDALSQQYRCIVADLWDHGNSGHLPHHIRTIHDLAECYHQFMQQLDIDQYSVVGLSVGGMWGADLALNHPDNVHALVLMDTFLGDEPPMTQQIYFGLMDIIEKTQQFIDPILDKVVPMFFSPKTIEANLPIVSAFRDHLSQTPKENIPGIVQLVRTIFSRESLLPRLNELQMPVQIIVGQDDIPRPPSESQQMAELISNVRLDIIENAGHISTLENPAQVTEALSQFIQEHIPATRARTTCC